MNGITLRIAEPSEYDALGTLMFEAVREGPTHYTKAQSEAWMPTPLGGADWATRLSEKQVIVAADEDQLLGFMTIEPGGYIDFAYIRPQAQKTGLFRRLFEAATDQAIAWGEAELSTHASLMAQPAFAAMGFTVDFHETVEMAGQKLARARMTKPL